MSKEQKRLDRQRIANSVLVDGIKDRADNILSDIADFREDVGRYIQYAELYKPARSQRASISSKLPLFLKKLSYDTFLFTVIILRRLLALLRAL